MARLPHRYPTKLGCFIKLVFFVVATSDLGLAKSAEVVNAFHPRDYPEKNVACPAVDRSDPDSHTPIHININYVHTTGSKSQDTIIMVHGWPGIWSTWARQITHFERDYDLLIPNLRGFYKSSHPGDVYTSGTYGDFVSDLTCVMDNAGVEQAICMGQVNRLRLCFEAARQRPDRFKAVIGLVVPYFPSVGPYIPTAHLAKMAPKLGYQVFFNTQTEKAVEELNQSVRRTLRAVVRAKDNPPPEEFLTSHTTFWSGYESNEASNDSLPQSSSPHESLCAIQPGPITFMSEEEEDYLVEAMEHQGFDRTLQFYLDTNRQVSHAHASLQGNHTIDTPSLLILPTHDRVAKWRQVLKLVYTEKFMTKLVVHDVEAAHWPQLEKPEEVNRMVREFLVSLKDENDVTTDDAGDAPSGHVGDELVPAVGDK
ncbi:hypothetical protein FRB99_006921 [Tulasnella sp. 403]|nr:hypothetical protein FRB99_006921 [Tulasnella sp. 403]